MAVLITHTWSHASIETDADNSLGLLMMRFVLLASSIFLLDYKCMHTMCWIQTIERDDQTRISVARQLPSYSCSYIFFRTRICMHVCCTTHSCKDNQPTGLPWQDKTLCVMHAQPCVPCTAFAVVIAYKEMK